MAVVVGDPGVGKTLCLKVVMESLNPVRHRIAYVSRPGIQFADLLEDIITQLECRPCGHQPLDVMLRRFTRLLFSVVENGRRIAIFVDDAHTLDPHTLDNLLLLTGMQEDTRSLFTLVLAGQAGLGKSLGDPRRENLLHRIGVSCRIRGIKTRDILEDYVEHRLERAGLPGDSPFTAEGYAALWALSGGGNPRLVNRLCKLALVLAQKSGVAHIGPDLIRTAATRLAGIHERLIIRRAIGGAVAETGQQVGELLPEFIPAAAPPRPIPAEADRPASELATRKMHAGLRVLDRLLPLAYRSADNANELDHASLAGPAFSQAG